jgi:heat shock protein HslJ
MISSLLLSLSLLLAPAAGQTALPAAPTLDCQAPVIGADGSIAIPDGASKACVEAILNDFSQQQAMEPMLRAVETTPASDDYGIAAVAGPDGEIIPVADGRLSITADGMLYASVGCNSLSGAVTVSPNGGLRLADMLVSTMMFCAELDSAEQALSAVLNGSDLHFEGDAIASSAGRIELAKIELAPIKIVDPGTGIAIGGVVGGIACAAQVGVSCEHGSGLCATDHHLMCRMPDRGEMRHMGHFSGGGLLGMAILAALAGLFAAFGAAFGWRGAQALIARLDRSATRSARRAAFKR